MKKGLTLARLEIAAALAIAFIVVLLFLALPSGEECQNEQRRDYGQQGHQRSGACKSWRDFATEDAAGLFTLWLVIIGGAQAALFGWQLSLMRESLADTKRAAKAAKRQARLARDSLIASNRAWLKVEVSPSGLQFAFDAGGAAYRATIVFQNIGTSPAISITPYAWLMSDVGSNVDAEFMNRCEKLRGSYSPYGASLFPNQAFPISIGDTESLIEAFASPDEVEKASTLVGERKRALLLLAGCINYTFPTDRTNHHQTRFLYEVRYGNDLLPVIEIPLQGEHVSLRCSARTAGQHAD